ncbi:hypothetical protein RDABS01_026043 [Bienertia sinuspersici]
MNNLISSSFSKYRENPGDLEMKSPQPNPGVNLDKFFDDAETIRDEMKDLEELHRKLRAANEESKTAHTSTSVKELRSKMDRDVGQALKKAKTIKVRLEALDRSNAANRNLPGCGPGSSSDRTRTSVVSGLRNKLVEKMEEFQELREKLMESIERLFKGGIILLLVKILIKTLLICSLVLGRGQILDTIAEIQERHDTVKDIERNLHELHQTFLDMAVLVQHQGEQLDDIEANVGRATSFVRGGTEQLQTARKHQKNTRKWTCFAIVLILVIILIVVLSLRPWEK